MSVVTDYPDNSPHYATAQQVSQTGVPLLAKSGNLVNHSGTITNPVKYDTGKLTVSQIGYEFQFTGVINAASTSPFVEINVTWTDSVSGLVTGNETYYPPCASAAPGFTLIARGPTKGDTVEVTIANNDDLHTITFTYILVEHSRVYQKDIAFGLNSVNNLLTIPGYNQAFGVDDVSVLGAIVNQTVTAGNNVSFLMSMAPGKQIQLAGNTAGVPAANVVITVFPENPFQFSGGYIALRQTLTVAAFNFTFIAPAAMLRLNVANTATSGTLTISGLMTAGA